jgi:hypothetical protein
MRLAKEIIESLNSEPKRWKLSRGINCQTLDRDDNLSLWIHGGNGGMHVYNPTNVDFPFLWRRKVWKAYIMWINNMSLEHLMNKG